MFLQILNQCTHKLSLASAARYIYTEDGTMILEVDDLVDWAVDNYKSLMVDQLERILSGKEERPPSRRLNMLFVLYCVGRT